MTSSIDPARRSPKVRRPRKSAAELIDELEEARGAAPTNLPAPIGSAQTLPPKSPVAGASTIEAQLQGERRGLRAGASLIDQAKVVYNRTQWSGSHDRRAPKGRTTKTEA